MERAAAVGISESPIPFAEREIESVYNWLIVHPNGSF